MRRNRPGRWTMALVLTMAMSASARTASEPEARAVGELFARALWGETADNGCRPYEDFSGDPAAYFCERLLDNGTSVTLLVGARTDLPPVLMYYWGRPPDVTDEPLARAVAERALARDGARKVAAVYYSPFDLWYEYEVGGERVMVSLRDLAVSDPDRVRSAGAIPCSPFQEARFEAQWQDYLSGARARSAGIPSGVRNRGGDSGAAPDSGRRTPGLMPDSQHWIAGVPDWDWHYGCAPTAAANVLTLWSRRGYGRLVDSVSYNVPDRLEGGIDSVPNVSSQLAVAMSTDTLSTGSTSADSIPVGVAAVCKDSAWANCYDFASYLAWNDHDLLISEIDRGRPGVLVLMGHPEYGNHAVTYCGWGPPDNGWIMVHDLWAGTPQDKVILYDYGCPVAVVPVIPEKAAGADVGVTSMLQPADELPPGPVSPLVHLSNFASSPAEATVFFRIEQDDANPGQLDGDGLKTTCYSDAKHVTLDAGQTLPVVLSPWQAQPGAFAARCSVYQEGDENGANDTITKVLLVTDRIAQPRGERSGARPGAIITYPNPAQRTLRIAGWTGPVRLRIYDPLGRCAMDRNLPDADRVELPLLAAGVYLLRLEWPGSAGATARFVVAGRPMARAAP